MGDAATPRLPDFTSQTASQYKANIDAGFAVADRLAWAFALHEQATPDMTVRVDGGAIFDGATLTEVAAQSTPAIAAPTTNPRIDRVVIDRATGAVSVVAGTEAASPTPPAIPAGKAPVARVSLAVGQTAITNADITDERSLGLLGLGALAERDAVGTADIANGAVTLAKIAAGADGTFIKSDGGVVSWATVDLPRGYIDGLVLSNDPVNPNTGLYIAPGQASDSTNTKALALSAAILKYANVAWTAGNGAGGLFAGAIAANTWYHVFIIERDSDGVIDAGFDTDINAANRPAGYTRYRRVGSISTDGSSNIVKFIQLGDVFHLPESAAYSGGQRAMALITFNVPPGLSVLPLLSAHVGVTSSAQGLIYLAPGADLTNKRRFFEFNAASGNGTGSGVGPPTNTNQQIGFQVAGSGTPSVDLWTNGWIDPRGKEA